MPRRKQVDAWFANYDNPMKPVVMAMRDAILAADPRVDECIKWQAPTFTYEGNLASFYPKSKQHASLMFHQGASIPGSYKRLEGTGDVSRVMKIGSLAELRAARAELTAIVRAWCKARDDGAATKRARGANAKTKTKTKTRTKTKKAKAAGKRRAKR